MMLAVMGIVAAIMSEVAASTKGLAMAKGDIETYYVDAQ